MASRLWQKMASLIRAQVTARVGRAIRLVWPERDPRRGRPIVRIHIRTAPSGF